MGQEPGGVAGGDAEVVGEVAGGGGAQGASGVGEERGQAGVVGEGVGVKVVGEMAFGQVEQALPAAIFLSCA